MDHEYYKYRVQINDRLVDDDYYDSFAYLAAQNWLYDRDYLGYIGFVQDYNPMNFIVKAHYDKGKSVRSSESFYFHDEEIALEFAITFVEYVVS